MTTLERIHEASIGLDVHFFLLLLNKILLCCRDLLNTFGPPQNNFLGLYRLMAWKMTHDIIKCEITEFMVLWISKVKLLYPIS